MWIAISLFVLAVILFFVGRLISGAHPGTGRGRHERADRPSRNSFRPEEAPAPPKRRLVVVVNPTKLERIESTTAQIRWVTDALDWELDVVETTVEHTGEAQARSAVASGADVVAAMGGDGTVRAVATGLAGTNTPMGIIPAGTGNLLFRNLGMDISTLESAVRVALTGENHHIDVAAVRLDPPSAEPDSEPSPEAETPADPGSEPPAETAPGPEAGSDPTEHSAVGPSTPQPSPSPDGQHIFLVMAGMGFDASVIGDADEDLKAKMGWPAYVVAGVRNLVGERFRVSVTPEGMAPIQHRARTVMIGNCGRLIAGIVLMPDAKVDDGLLDAVVVAPKSLPGWVGVTSTVLRRGKRSTSAFDRYTSPAFTITADGPQEVQLDGDHIGTATSLQVQAWPRALILRLPSGAVRQASAPAN